MCLLDGGHKETRRARYCINASLLSNLEFKTTLTAIWKETEAKGCQQKDPPEKVLRRCMREMCKATKIEGKKRTKERQAKWEEARGRVNLYSKQLEADVGNSLTQSKLQEAKDTLEELEMTRARWIQQKIDAKWIEHGDLPSRIFFGLFKSRQKQMEIKSLVNEQGEEVSEEKEMEHLAEEHFRKLLSEDKADEERAHDIQNILSKVKGGLTEEEQTTLDQPLTEAELLDAATEMKVGKSPGPDGAPVEFLVDLWETAGPLIARVITKGAEGRWFPGWFNRGDVVLLPKGGDIRKLGNKRPITLLNSIYKIYTKALQKRIVLRSKPVRVSRSVRQGCPLSPLLFILVTQTLTAAVDEEVAKGYIQGIFLQKANVHYSLGFYADDSHIIIRAIRDCAVNTKTLLDSFANATGLQIQWDKSTARWIGPRENNKPSWVTELAWCWKHRGEDTKLLGFSFEEGIKPEKILQKCKVKINQVCSNPLYGNLSIIGRVTVANASLLGVFWYLIPLWAGNLKELQTLEKKVVNFVWSGASLDTRNRAATAIIVQGTKEGGLGLISLTKQYMAFAARTMRWAYTHGGHPLQAILRGYVDDELMAAFGTPGPQWVYTAARSKLADASPVVTNIFQAWAKMKVHIKHGQQRRLAITDRKSVETAYEKILLQLQDPRDTRLHEDEEIGCAFETESAPGVLWEWKIKGGNKEDVQQPPNELGRCKKYQEIGGIAHPCKLNEEPDRTLIYRPVTLITYRIGQGKKLRVRADGVPEGADELAKLKWRNDSGFFTATNGQIRNLLTKNKEIVTEKMRRWTGVADVQPENSARWKRIWRARRARKEGFLLWSICYRIAPTNAWRFPSLPNSDPLRWCKRCTNNVAEDTLHTFWQCPVTKITWSTVGNFVARAVSSHISWRPSCSQALLAEPLPKEMKQIAEWWECLRGATLWGIWSARNACNFNNEVWHQIKIDNLIWYRFTLYLRIEWRITQVEAREEFQRNWAFELSGIATVDDNNSDKLRIPRLAPWRKEGDNLVSATL
ncbi:hypothetical protein R1sor_006224 [Riccia sorocarpa]|uniref:Reverse transcriptase domain-containing protein n=1 Tax=Riccia sorocarpa TaxID=122646 RepID=A0ABD3HMA2_9MARC